MKSINPIPMVTLDEEGASKILDLIEILSENEDVVDVWSNLSK
jgi:transcriptional/translational regulatory protein YebC/TACO1